MPRSTLMDVHGHFCASSPEHQYFRQAMLISGSVSWWTTIRLSNTFGSAHPHANPEASSRTVFGMSETSLAAWKLPDLAESYFLQAGRWRFWVQQTSWAASVRWYKGSRQLFLRIHDAYPPPILWLGSRVALWKAGRHLLPSDREPLPFVSVPASRFQAPSLKHWKHLCTSPRTSACSPCVQGAWADIAQ